MAAAHILLRPGRDHMRALDVGDVYYLEATGETTLVRTRSSRRLRDLRSLGELTSLLAPPVNRVLPVSRTAISDLWAGFAG